MSLEVAGQFIAWRDKRYPVIYTLRLSSYTSSMHNQIDFTAAIIAGGKSIRMGSNKALMRVGGVLMIERVVNALRDLGQRETILITNTPDVYAFLNLTMIADALPDTGSLGGIYTAILHSAAPYTLVAACDMPFLNPALLHYLIERQTEAAAPYDVIAPRVDGYPEGMHALYSKACLAPIRARLDARQLKIIGFYDDVKTRYVDEDEWRALDPDGKSFQNINTPDELNAANHGE
jgi:molybdopterin-guanine dinucleotide biosynthesis protein A